MPRLREAAWECGLWVAAGAGTPPIKTFLGALCMYSLAFIVFTVGLSWAEFHMGKEGSPS